MIIIFDTNMHGENSVRVYRDHRLLDPDFPTHHTLCIRSRCNGDVLIPGMRARDVERMGNHLLRIAAEMDAMSAMQKEQL
jgi:hypothetical protein